MTDVTVLVTGCGAPGFPGTCYSLRNNWDDRSVHIVGTDMRASQAGRYLADEFYQVPAAEDEGFVGELLKVCRMADVDVVLPQVTRELPVLADENEWFESVGTTVAVSDPETIELANDKHRLAAVADSLDVPVPETTRVETAEELTDAATQLGYPERPVVVKPPVSNGSRGVRILDATRDRKQAFYEEKPDGRTTTLASVREILDESFPPLLVMEYLPGPEYTIDAFRPADGGETRVVPRRRDTVKSGISFANTMVDDDALIEYTRRLADDLDLAYAFGFQFKEDEDGNPRLLECNPRIQGTMVASTLADANVTYAAVVDALGESVPPFDPDWRVTFHRYWGGVGAVGETLRGNIGEQ